MNTAQIEARLRCNKLTKGTFLGVFAKDQLPRKPRKKRFSMVINCCPSYLKGEHWVAVYVEKSKLNKSIVDFFCSFGISYKKYGFPLKKYGKIIRFHTFQLQPISSETCGNHCIFFIQMRSAGFTYNQILNEIYNSDKYRNDKLALISSKNECIY